MDNEPEDRRARQVKTTKEVYGPDYYEKNGRKKHKRGFSDPKIASAAAKKMHELKRMKKELEKKKNEPIVINSESSENPETSVEV